jgi:hypothetical protein
MSISREPPCLAAAFRVRTVPGRRRRRTSPGNPGQEIVARTMPFWRDAKRLGRGLAPARRLGSAVSLRAVLVLVLVLCPMPGTATESSLKATEYELKAAFLFNFARFAEWPQPSTRDDALVLGVLGEDPFGPVLDETIRGKTVGGRSLTARRISRLADCSGCDLVFVASSERARVSQVLRTISGPGVLTVGETEQFAERGGVIELAVESGRIRLIINTDAAARSGVRISAKLLSMASIVHDKREKGR